MLLTSLKNVQNIVDGLKGVVNIADDVLVFAMQYESLRKMLSIFFTVLCWGFHPTRL